MADAAEVNDNVVDETPDPAPPKDETKYVSLETFQTEMKKMTDAILQRPQPQIIMGGNQTAPVDNDPWSPANVAASTRVTEDDDEETKTTKYVRRQLAPLVQEFRSALSERDNVNFGALDELGTEVLSSKMPHYQKYKKEVDEVFNGMAPAVRARPSARMTAYKIVLAEHIDELVEEKYQAKVRAEVKGGDAPAPTDKRRSRVFDAKKGVPSPQDLGFTEDQVAHVEEKYGDWDRFAVKVSSGRFKNYADYAKSRAKQLGYDIVEEDKKKK
jgi:hypothetical protein